MRLENAIVTAGTGESVFGRFNRFDAVSEDEGMER